MHSVWLHQGENRCYSADSGVHTTRWCWWELGELWEGLSLDLILRACESPGRGSASGNCRLLCWSLSKGSSIKKEVCSKLNSPFGSWFYCPVWSTKKCKGIAGLEKEKEYENPAKTDAFLPVEHNNIFFKVDSSSFQRSNTNSLTRIRTRIWKPGTVASAVHLEALDVLV